VRQGGVAEDGGDHLHLKCVGRQREEDGRGVVDTGVSVDDDACHELPSRCKRSMPAGDYSSNQAGTVPIEGRPSAPHASPVLCRGSSRTRKPEWACSSYRPKYVSICSVSSLTTSRYAGSSRKLRVSRGSQARSKSCDGPSGYRSTSL